VVMNVHGLHNAPTVFARKTQHPLHSDHFAPVPIAIGIHSFGSAGGGGASGTPIGALALIPREVMLPQNITQPRFEWSALHRTRDLKCCGPHRRVNVRVRPVRVLQRADRLVRHGKRPNVQDKSKVHVGAHLVYTCVCGGGVCGGCEGRGHAWAPSIGTAIP
jgi:hypothetical protein